MPFHFAVNQIDINLIWYEKIMIVGKRSGMARWVDPHNILGPQNHTHCED